MMQTLRAGQRRQRGRGAALAAQRRALAAACKRHGWQPLALSDGPRSRQTLPANKAEGKTLTAGTLAPAEQALLELAALLASAQKQGWALSALDCDPEPSTGEAVVNVRATFTPCEQQLISARIQVALARARARGVRLGRPPTMPAHLIERIRRERAAGKSLAAIANGLNADRVPTAQGGRRWYPATIRHTLNRTH